MPELTPTGAVDVVERQVRRVRRRKNLYELQRTIYLTIAAGAGAAIVLLPFALLASTAAFAVAAACILGVMLGIAMLLAGALRRRWLARGRAVAWVESHGGLGGRVQTLIELATRTRSGTGFFQALLASQVGAGLDTWTPRRLVPRGVPRAAGATALVALALLAIVVRLASLALPTPPAIGISRQPITGERTDLAAGAMPGERVVVAPGVPQDDGGGSSPATDDGRDDQSTLTQLSSAVQENVRQQVWGKAWERVRDALARAGTSSRSEAERDAHRTNDDAMDDATADDLAGADANEWDVARAPSERSQPRAGHASARPGDATNDQHNEAHAGDQPDPDAGEADGPEGGASAGNGTSPGDLFGGAPVAPGAGNASFELSLAARMRSDRRGHTRDGGPAPEADPDARPALGSEQRRESAAHRMTVPAAYEHVVREVFAHREEP